MSIFISYSHNDKDFAEKLCTNLVLHKKRIWIDRWELSVGDSIINKIQEAIQSSGALLIILSKSSIQSEWCKKELTSGLTRELEEKKVFVLPVLLDDCDIPLFLRDKKYADFRKDFDEGFNGILEATARISNDTQSRIKHDNFHVDWAIDWVELDNGLFSLRFTLVEQVNNYPYTVLTEVVVFCNDVATRRYKQYKNAGLDWWGRFMITEILLKNVPNKDDYYILIEDQMPVIQNITIHDQGSNSEYHLQINCRRLGEDTGKDTIMDVGRYLDDIRKYLKEITKTPTKEEKSKIQTIAQSPIN